MRPGILLSLGFFLVSLSAWAGDNATAPGDSCAGGAITAGMQQALNNGIYLCTTTGATQNWYPEALYIGTSSATCDSAHAGLTRYNSGALELCDGTSWVNPGNAATIVLGSTATGANPRRSGDATTGLFSPAASTVAITTNGTEALRVTATGSVGIGTTAPSVALDVYGTDGTTPFLKASASSTAAYLGLGTSGILMNRPSGSNAMLQIITLNSGTWGAQASAGEITLNPKGVQALVAQGSGNIGIGTGSPTNILSLGGDSARTFWMERRTTANTAGNDLTIQAGGAASGATDKNGGNLILSSGIGTGASTSQIQFKVFPAGSAGTADTSAVTAMALSATSSTIPVLALGGSSMIAADTTTGGSEALGLLRGTTGTPGTTALIVGTGSSNGNGASLSASGTWTNASDARIKEHVRPIAYGLDALLALKPVAYEMKGTHDPQIGFIAQEVEPIIPEVVFHPQNLETEHFGLSYGNMVAVTVKAIQEQEQTIRTQQAAISLLAEKVRQQQQEFQQKIEDLERRFEQIAPTVH